MAGETQEYGILLRKLCPKQNKPCVIKLENSSKVLHIVPILLINKTLLSKKVGLVLIHLNLCSWGR